MQTQSNEPTRRYQYRIFPALVVVAIGVIFLIRNLGVEIPFLDIANWWAWFILIAALVPLFRAYETYRTRGRVDAEVGNSLLTAAAMLLVATMFLLGLDWKVWWPLFVILGGLFTLVRNPYRSRYGYRRRHAAQDTDDATFKR